MIKSRINLFLFFMGISVISHKITYGNDQRVSDGYFFKNYYIPNFDKAMIGDEKDKGRYLNLIIDNKEAKKFFDLARSNYNRYMFDAATYSMEPKIPKIIHQIWVGGPVPKEYLSWIETWKQHHPDWVHKLWTDADIPSLKLVNKKHFDRAKKGAEKADILRLELVYRFGGLYVDIDFKCFKSFDLFHHMCDFYTAFHMLKLLRYGRVANGLLAARPKHPILKRAVEEVGKNRHHKELMFRTGPDFFTKIIKQTLPGLAGVNIIFPANYFYPYGESSGWGMNIQHDGKIFVKPETVAAHFYENNW